MTIAELIKGKELPLKIVCKQLKHDWFEVQHANSKAVLGVDSNGVENSWLTSSEDWELYQEPKKTFYEYFLTTPDSCLWAEWHKSDESFLKKWPHKPIIKTGRSMEIECDI